MERWRRMQIEMRTVGPVSSTPAPDREGERSQEFAERPDYQPDHIAEHKELHSTLARAIGTLPERYQKVVSLYYTDDMTMKEIGDVLGVNESRVSQIHKTALQKMQAALRSEGLSMAAF
jgi:RNA polymerase sigma factor for flagellar operon FliA